MNITTYKYTYIKTYVISIIVRYNYLHGVQSASGELIGNLVKVSLGYGKIRSCEKSTKLFSSLDLMSCDAWRLFA